MRIISFITFLICALGLGDSLSPLELKSRIRKEIQKELPQVARLYIDGLDTKGSANIARTARIRILAPHPPLGLVQLRVEWFDNGHKGKNIKAVVRAYAPVAVSKLMIRSGEAFGLNNVSLEDRELNAHIMSGYYLDWIELSKVRARGFIRAGVVLGRSNTQRPYLVVRGQTLDLVHREGALKLTARVKAMSKGREGDWIQVQNPTSKKVFSARVTGSGTAETR